MSRLICASAIDGAVEWVARAESMLDRAISEKGGDAKVGFPGRLICYNGGIEEYGFEPVTDCQDFVGLFHHVRVAKRDHGQREGRVNLDHGQVFLLIGRHYLRAVVSVPLSEQRHSNLRHLPYHVIIREDVSS